MNLRPPGRNNPWGIQAQNWNMPMSRGPPPQQFNQAGPSIQQNRFYSPSTQQTMAPRFQAPQFGQNCGPSRFHGPPPNNHMPMNNSIRTSGFGGNVNNAPFNGPPGPQHRQHHPNTSPGPQHRQHNPNTSQMSGWSPRGQGPRGNQSSGQFQRSPRFQQQKDNVQKKKKKKRDPAVNGESCEFYCDTCDRGYKDKDKYDLHVGQHEKCPKDGCSYIAAGKLVQLHIKLQHNSGLAKKIWSLETKKDIDKWRQERKKNFPTTENIEKKKSLIAEKIARGEVIEEKYFGKMHRRNDRGKDRRQNGRNNGNKNVKDRMQDMKRKLDEDKKEDECSKEKQVKTGDTGETSKDSLSVFFNGQESDTTSSDDEDSTKLNTADKKPSTDQEKKAAGALGSLISSYVDSDGNSDTEGTDIVKSQAKTMEMSKKEENSVEQTPDTKSVAQQQKQEYRQKQRTRQRQKKHDAKTTSNILCDKSLLEKLLAKEIRQERNKILQCVHYIVKNNFFDK